MGSLANNLPAAVAFNRFGLGARPSDPIPASVTAWLTGQLSGPDPASGAGLPSSADGLALYESMLTAPTTAQQQALSQQIFQTLATEIQAYLQNALTTQVPFRERLVQFWTNHFALMCKHESVACCAGAFVREAIRPYVNGTFTQMLLAVMQHPAMLYNLNNTASIGPQSVAGRSCQSTACTDRGINENLARECLELHTVGINAGYTQADVDALAMLLTGWTTQLTTAPRGFIFNPRTHQPGSQVLMGQTFDGSQAGGIAALTWLSTHPATYQHLATELVTQFVSDTPAASDIATVAAALSGSGGNLAAAATALVGLSNAWVPFAKLRTPMDYVIAVLRAAGAAATGSIPASNAAAVVMSLGMPVWQSTFPNGYSDLASVWGGPAQMLLRGDWINTLTGVLTVDPATVMSDALGPLLQPATLAAVNQATSPQAKLALLFLSPEFQRR